MHQAARSASYLLYKDVDFVNTTIEVGQLTYAVIGASPRPAPHNTRTSTCDGDHYFDVRDRRGLFLGEVKGSEFVVVGGNAPLKWP